MLDTATRSLVSLGDANPHVLRHASAQLSPVTDAARYRRSAGGVRVYVQMGLDAAYVPDFSATVAICSAAAPELLRKASLVHDDLLDGDTPRCGKPAFWSLYGRHFAIWSGEFVDPDRLFRHCQLSMGGCCDLCDARY